MSYGHVYRQRLCILFLCLLFLGYRYFSIMMCMMYYFYYIFIGHNHPFTALAISGRETGKKGIKKVDSFYGRPLSGPLDHIGSVKCFLCFLTFLTSIKINFVLLIMQYIGNRYFRNTFRWGFLPRYDACSITHGFI